MEAYLVNNGADFTGFIDRVSSITGYNFRLSENTAQVTQADGSIVDAFELIPGERNNSTSVVPGFGEALYQLFVDLRSKKDVQIPIHLRDINIGQRVTPVQNRSNDSYFEPFSIDSEMFAKNSGTSDLFVAFILTHEIDETASQGRNNWKYDTQNDYDIYHSSAAQLHLSALISVMRNMPGGQIVNFQFPPNNKIIPPLAYLDTPLLDDQPFKSFEGFRDSNGRVFLQEYTQDDKGQIIDVNFWFYSPGTYVPNNYNNKRSGVLSWPK